MTAARNIATPVQRGAADFEAAQDDDLLRMQIEQVLGTECNPSGTGGEMPWRTAFGTPLHLLRHRAGSEVTQELARVWIRNALKKWAPRAQVTAVEIAVDSETLTVRVRYTTASGAAGTAKALLPVS